MSRNRVRASVICSSLLLSACVHPGNSSPLKHVGRDTRLDAIQRAHVWSKVDIPSMDVTDGPRGPGAFAPGETVNCDYVDKSTGGNSPKFVCAVGPEDEVKVKYGKNNGEVYAEVAATRLFWALGFGADRFYPVRVVCFGCPRDPAVSTGKKEPEVVFDPATIERKMPGAAIETSDEVGWSWTELDNVGGADSVELRTERDALKLLAVFVQHTDSKDEQQRLVCLSGKKKRSEGEGERGSTYCDEPFLMVHDLGQTFGHGNLFNRDQIGSTNLEEWSRASIWLDGDRCIGNLHQSQTGTLDRPLIKEAGRKFLADLLLQLSDVQLRDLFTVARFPERSEQGVHAASVDQWVEAFKQKRSQIVDHTCPAS